MKEEKRQEGTLKEITDLFQSVMTERTTVLNNLGWTEEEHAYGPIQREVFVHSS